MLLNKIRNSEKIERGNCQYSCHYISIKCAHTYTYACPHMHACTPTYIYAHMHARTHTRAHPPAYTYMHARTYTCTCPHTCMPTYIYTHVRLHIHTCTYTHVCPHICTCMPTYMYTHRSAYFFSTLQQTDRPAIFVIDFSFLSL